MVFTKKESHNLRLPILQIHKKIGAKLREWVHASLLVIIDLIKSRF